MYVAFVSAAVVLPVLLLRGFIWLFLKKTRANWMLLSASSYALWAAIMYVFGPRWHINFMVWQVVLPFVLLTVGSLLEKRRLPWTTSKYEAVIKTE